MLFRSVGGKPGYAAVTQHLNVAGYGTDGISPGLATNNTSNTLLNTAGQFTLSPAV